LGKPAEVEERGSESWEDGVEEEIDVEDWWEELGGGQREPMRSQVREESSGEGLGGVLDFEGGLLLARRTWTLLQDWSREGREQRERKA
jgi:hypothetical protein